MYAIGGLIFTSPPRLLPLKFPLPCPACSTASENFFCHATGAYFYSFPPQSQNLHFLNTTNAPSLIVRVFLILCTFSLLSP